MATGAVLKEGGGGSNGYWCCAEGRGRWVKWLLVLC